MMSDQPPPYTVPFELAGVSDRGAELSLSPDAAERARIAAWLGALEVPRLDTTIRLSREDDDVYRYDADFTAEVVQACVVTLEPVPSLYTGRAERRYRVVARAQRRPSRSTDIPEIDPGDDDAPEVILSSLLDIAAPILEEISLLLDPYPRAPGVTFDPPKDAEGDSDNPFAVLAKLKSNPSKGPGSGG
jgi:uncharacterized metal-binding protein YceD (DUF177 family)